MSEATPPNREVSVEEAIARYMGEVNGLTYQIIERVRQEPSVSQTDNVFSKLNQTQRNWHIVGAQNDLLKIFERGLRELFGGVANGDLQRLLKYEDHAQDLMRHLMPEFVKTVRFILGKSAELKLSTPPKSESRSLLRAVLSWFK